MNNCDLEHPSGASNERSSITTTPHCSTTQSSLFTNRKFDAVEHQTHHGDQYDAKCRARVHFQTSRPALLQQSDKVPVGRSKMNKISSYLNSPEGKEDIRIKWRGSSSLTIDESSISSGESREEFEREAPDGGWGWVVVFASFMVHCIADGVTMSFGVLYVEFLSYFEESKSVTSWIGSLFMAVPLLAGPLASWATDRYGCRTVTICGSLVACFGFALSSLSNSILVLFLTIGLITGLGLAFCYVASIVIVAFYFEKKLSLATGIAVAGSGIGTFLFAPFIHYLITAWGWRGALLILSGGLLNISVAGFLMRDLQWTRKKSHSSCSSCDTWKGSLPQQKAAASQSRLPTQPSANGHLYLSRSSSLIALPTFINNNSAVVNSELLDRKYDSSTFEIFPNLPTSSFIHSNKPFPTACMPPLAAKSALPSFQSKQLTGQLSLQKDHSPEREVVPMAKSSSCSDYLSSTTTKDQVSYKKERRITQHTKPTAKQRKITVVDMLTNSSHLHAALPVLASKGARKKRESMTFRGAVVNISRHRPRSKSCPNIYRKNAFAPDSGEQHMTLYLKHINQDLDMCLVPNLRSNFEVALFAISNFIMYVFYDTVYMYLSDYAQGVGISEESSADLISVIGLVNCVGMIVMGYLGDRPDVSPIFVYLISMVFCGVSVILIPFVSEFWLLATLCGTFGLFISANYALTSVILVELVSLDAFGKTYGLMLLIQGVANLIGPPLVGFLADATGTYFLAFVVSGVSIAICGLMLLAIPIWRTCSNGSISTSPSTAQLASV